MVEYIIYFGSRAEKHQFQTNKETHLSGAMWAALGEKTYSHLVLEPVSYNGVPTGTVVLTLLRMMTTFSLDLKLMPRRQFYAWYSNLGQKPRDGDLIDLILLLYPTIMSSNCL